jgi:hypothetical protein
MFSLAKKVVLCKPLQKASLVAFGLIVNLCCLNLAANAQFIPSFPGGTKNSFSIAGSTGMIQMPSYEKSLFLAYLIYTTNSGTPTIGAAYSADGTHFVNLGAMVDTAGGNYTVNCNVNVGTACGVSIAMLGPIPYMTFADGKTGGLDIVQIFPQPGNTFSYHLVQHDDRAQLTSIPSMSPDPSGTHLIIRYGTSLNPPLKNVAYVSSLDQSGNLSARYQVNGYSPTQSGLVVFNSYLHAMDKQDNSDNGVFVSTLDDRGYSTDGTGGTQVSGWYTPQGIAALVLRGAIVALVQSTQSNHDLWAFSSLDGQTWRANDYGSSIRIGGTPAMATFNTNVCVTFRANDSTNALFATCGPQ